ncbi:hypothetical protein SH597_04570 [Lacticaseibacillus paracasei]|uniref:Phage protein n=1 Tax=Lacticaseibacillus paracasei TaxID=1597 RepID=A0ABD7BQH7_LACPA|nr:hypothetical protein [Lacticaseibacillus paracasei]ARE43374.1 hypothetical protein A3778_04345 [Lacticaseibacillus paracasei]QOP54910.1 hypothetical protein HCJ88_03590 [Lacticaseibacillus paracasei]QPB56475.1 hypothetical protein GFB64_04900 [Lacticaseibacillus paracasei]WPQ31532.1 hypothetical protein SH597_04570 [Lacticaseibacillus paracasei]
MDDEYDNLTNEAKLLLLKLYQVYQDRIAVGMPRNQARHTGHLDAFKPLTLPNYSKEDVRDYAFELERHGFLDVSPADNTVYDSSLTTEAIAKMQNRFKNGVKAAINTLVKFL